jgi:hypothetical protein
MVSDNASTYQSAAEELILLFNSAELETNLSKRGIQWKFIPKRAPSYGGFWERLIGLTKNSLKKVLGKANVTLEELQTISSETEAILNDRPLTHVSSELEDAEPLTDNPIYCMAGELPIYPTPFTKTTSFVILSMNPNLVTLTSKQN